MSLPVQYYLCPLSTFLQAFTDAGQVLTNALIWTYQAGTSTPTSTWQDNGGVTPNSNPIQLNAAGRLTAPIWQQGGVPIKVQVSTNAGTVLAPVFGTQIGPTLDQMSGIDDPAGLLTTLGTATSGFGADLIANGMRSYPTFGDIRAANVPSLVTGQSLVVDATGANLVTDNLGGLFYWNATSTATDDSSTVLKPNALSTAQPGRYIRQRSNGFTGTATATLGGVLGTVTTVLQYFIIGNYASVRIPQVNGTSTSTVMTLSVGSTQSANLNPFAAQWFDVAAIEDNGTAAYAQVGSIAPAGTSGVLTYTFYKNGNAGGFTASSTKGISDGGGSQFSVFINYALD